MIEIIKDLFVEHFPLNGIIGLVKRHTVDNMYVEFRFENDHEGSTMYQVLERYLHKTI